MASSTPSWLPPLNSHENYIIQVQASETQKPPMHHFTTKIRFPAFLINLSVTVDYYFPEQPINDDTGIIFPGLSLDKTLQIDRNPKTLLASLHEHVLNQNLVPFQLQNCRWRENSHRSRLIRQPWILSNDEDEILDKILNFLLILTRKPENATRTILSVDLEIHKKVRVSMEELLSWMAWYEERVRVNPGFGEEFEDAISRPRDETELVEEAMLLMAARKSASCTSVDELESFTYDVDNSSNGGDGGSTSAAAKSCLICLEEYVSGKDRVVRLPCLHVFHGDCVVRWLRGNHVCPLCRFQLPTDDGQ